MEVQTISVPRTAHYYLIGEPGPQIEHVIIATHGYGQLARKFIQDLAPIATDKTLIVAPEGMSKFYWGGFDGPTVASWMTREHRLDEITDFANYLQLLYESIIIQLPKEVQITFLGFSQGVATLWRWIHAKQPYFHRIICWAGWIPEDIEYDFMEEYLKDKQLYFTHGHDDPFLTHSRIDKLMAIIKEKGLHLQHFTFEGKHDIPAEALTSIMESIREREIDEGNKI